MCATASLKRKSYRVTPWSGRRDPASQAGEEGDYLITTPTSQRIVAKDVFDSQFALADKQPAQREPLGLPAATGPEVVSGNERVTPWQNGQIIRTDDSITVTNTSNRSSRTYVDGRLAREERTISTPAGDIVVASSNPYDDLARVKELPSLDSYKQDGAMAEAEKLAQSTAPTYRIDTPERNGLRKQLGADEIKRLEEQYHPESNGRAVIIIAASGSGKSTIAEEAAKEIHGAVADVDMIKPGFPEWRDGKGAAALAKEANEVYQPVIDSLLYGDKTVPGDVGKKGIVIPMVANNEARAQALLEKLNEIGYHDIKIVHVGIPTQESARRINLRQQNGGMSVSMSYLENMADVPSRNFTSLVDRNYLNSDKPLLSGFYRINNFNNKPTIVEEGFKPGHRGEGFDPAFFDQVKVRAAADVVDPAAAAKAAHELKLAQQARLADLSVPITQDAFKAAAAKQETLDMVKQA